MRVGALSNPRRELLAQLRWAAANGLAFVEVSAEPPHAALERTSWRAVGAAARELNLELLVHAAPWLPVTSPSPIIRQAALDELRRTIDAAALLGAPLVTLEFVPWPHWMAERDGYESYRQLLTILCNHSAAQQVQVALENSATNSHQLKYFREICARVPPLRLTLDVAHTNVGTVRPLTRDYCFALADRLEHVHLSDNDGASDGRLPFGAPVAGGIDLLTELRALRSFRYDSRLTLEIQGDVRWLLGARDLLNELWPHAA